MSTETYDLIVLGAGSAARDGAGKAAREHGARVAMVERTRWGGSCPNVACRPTKAYLVAAELMHDVREHAAERGIDLPAPAIDVARTRAWKDSLRRDQDSWVQMLREVGYGVYPGEASFVDANTVNVGDTTLTAEKVLIATGGRTAVPPIPGIDDVEWIDHISALELTDVEELNLDSIGVEIGRGGVVVDGRQRTSVPGIWAAGDVAAGPMFTPTAQYQARIAVEDMFGNGARTADYSVLPTAIFTDPELGAVGLTEAEARARGYDVGVATHPVRAVTRAQYYGTKRGLYKIVYDRASRRVLGVHVVSRGASDIVGGLAVALGLGATVDDLAAVHHVYPSFSEGLKAAAEQAA